MTDLFTQLAKKYEHFKREQGILDSRAREEAARKLLSDIRDRAQSISIPTERSILSHRASDLGETIFELSGIYPPVDLKPFVESEGQQPGAEDLPTCHPFLAPDLPQHFIPRPQAIPGLKARLVAEPPDQMPVTVIHGLGGTGKSTLAIALAHDEEVQDRFPDGVFWATLGANTQLLHLLNDWIRAMGAYRLYAVNLEKACDHLRKLLQDKAALLVADDAWDTVRVLNFIVGGPRCHLLITTREASIARALRAELYSLDVMTPSQAFTLLEMWLGRAIEGEERIEAEALINEVGRLPLALELAAALIVEDGNWAGLLTDLQREVARLEVLSQPSTDAAADGSQDKHASLTACFNLSLQRLSEAQRRAFAWLGVLPADTILTPRITSTLWQTDTEQAQNTLRYLADRALLTSCRSAPGDPVFYCVHVLVHDTARHLLTAPTAPVEDGDLAGLGNTLSQAHQQLLRHYGADTEDGCFTLPNDGYIHGHLTYHMEGAGWNDRVHALLRRENSEGNSAWYETCEREGQTAGYVQSVSHSWEIAEKEYIGRDSHLAIGLQCRCALIIASLNSWADQLTEPQLAALASMAPARGLAYARQMTVPWRRGRALAKLAPNLPKELLPEALAVARALPEQIPFFGGYARSEALTELMPHLPEKGAKEALEAISQIKNEQVRARYLGRLAPDLPASDLKKALDIARSMQNERARTEALTSLIPHLPEDLKPELLKIVGELPERSLASERMLKTEALIELAPRLPAPLLEEAVRIAQEIGNEQARAQALSGLAPHLPEEWVEEVLAAARGIGDETIRVNALVSLIPHLSKPTQEQVLEEVLAIMQGLDERTQADVVMAIAPCLPDRLVGEVLDVTRDMKSDWWRTNAQYGLAVHHNIDGRERAITAAYEAVEGLESEQERAEALINLVSCGREKTLARDLAAMALAIAQGIGDGRWRAKALGGLASCVPNDVRRQAWEDALDVVPTIESEWARVDALKGLASRLPGGLLSKALAIAQAIEIELARAEALIALAPRLPKTLLGGVFTAGQNLQDEGVRAAVLIDLAPYLSKGLRKKAWTTVQEIQNVDIRGDAVMKLTPYLASPSSEQVFEPIADDVWRTIALVALAPHLPAGRLKDLLRVVRDTKDEEIRATALVDLARQLPKGLMTAALAIVQDMEEDTAYGKALIGLAPYLSKALRKKAQEKAGQIQAEGDRLSVLGALGPHPLKTTQGLGDIVPKQEQPADELDALSPDQLKERLQKAAQADPPKPRAETLRHLASALSRLPSSELLEYWGKEPGGESNLLHTLANRSRKHLLSDLSALAPVIHKLGGEEAIDETFCAIQDVCRWWP